MGDERVKKLNHKKSLFALLLFTALLSLFSLPAFGSTNLEVTYISGPEVLYDSTTAGPSLFTLGVAIRNTGGEPARNVIAVLDFAPSGSWTYGYGEPTSSGTITSGTASRSFITPLSPNATYTAFWTVKYPCLSEGVVHTFTVTVKADNASPIVYNGTLTTHNVSATGVGGTPVGTLQGITGGILEFVVTYDYGNVGDSNAAYVQPTGNKVAVGATPEIIFDASMYRLTEIWGTYTYTDLSPSPGTFSDKLYFPLGFFGNAAFLTAHYKFFCLAEGQNRVVPYGAKVGAQNQYNNSYNDETTYVTLQGSCTLSLNKTVDFGTITPGGTLTYTIVYKNTSGTYTANYISITDVIPGSTTYISLTGNGTYNPTSNKIIWDIGSVGTNTQGTVTFTVRVNNVPAGTITNIAELYIADNASPTLVASVTTTVYNVPPVIQVVSPNGGEYWSGTNTIRWTYSDSNGTTTIGYVMEYSTIGTTWIGITTGTVDGSAVIGTATYDWNVGTLTDGTYTIRVVGTDTYSGGLGPAPGRGTDTSDAYFTIDNTPPQVTITSPTMSSPATKSAGQIVSITFTYTELNPGTYTIRIFNGATTIGSKTVTSGLVGGTNISVTSDVTLSMTAQSGSYTVEVVMIDKLNRAATSTEVGAVQVRNPKVEVVSTAPSKLIDFSDTDDLLKISIFNDTTTSPVEWAKVDIKFTTNGTTPITGTEADKIFNYLKICVDDASPGTFTDLFDDPARVTFSDFSSMGTSGILSITLPDDDDSYFKINSGATKTFFVVVKLESNASAQGTKTFILTIDENGTQGANSELKFIVDDNFESDVPMALEQSGSELVNSGTCSAIPTDPTVMVENTAQNILKDDDKDDLLKIAVKHNSSTEAGNLEFAYLTVKFTSDGNPITGTTTPQKLFKNIFVYRDGTNTNIGSYGNEDICVGTVTQGSITLTANGTISIKLIDPSIYTLTSYNTATTYFLVVELTEYASGDGTRTFSAVVNASGGDVVIEDETTDIQLDLTGSSSTSVKSTQVKAIPKDPQVQGTDTASPKMVDGADDDILKIIVTHTGTSSSGNIGLGTLTFKFTKDGTITLSNTDATTLFEYFYIYRDTGNGSYSSASDTRVGTWTPNLTSGEQTFIFDTADDDVKTEGGSITTYFLVIKLTGTASGYGTDTFAGALVSGSCFDFRDKFALTTTVICGTSTPTKVISVSPEVDVTNIAPLTIRENGSGTLLKLKLIHHGSVGAEDIIFGSITIRFGSDTNTPLSTSQAQALFKNVYIYFDVDKDETYTQGVDNIIVGSLTQANISGTITVDLEEGTRTTLEGGTSSTYFLVVELTGTASSASPNVFIATIREDIDPVVREADTKGTLTLATSDIGTSTQVTAIPPNPDVGVVNTAPSPAKMSDSELEDLLFVTLTHKGLSGSNDIKFATLTIKLTCDGSTALNTGQAKALFEKIIIYYDTDGIFDVNDTIVGSVTNTSISLDGNGKQKIDFYNISQTTVSVNSPKSYFVAVELKGTASAATPNTFAATVDGDEDATIRDTVSNYILSVNPTSSITSSVITAQGTPTPPNVYVWDSAPSSGQMSDGEINDLLRIELVHTGDSLDADIEMATLTLKFTNGTPTYTTLSNATATGLFQNVYIYLDQNNDDNFNEGTDIQVFGTTNVKATMTIGFVDGNINVQVPQSVGTKTYLLVVRLTGGAHDYGSFSATINGADFVVQDVNTDKDLSLGATNIGTSTTVGVATAEPTIIVESTAPGTTTIDPIYGRMINGTISDVLRLKVSHNGIPATTGLIFATVTVKFTDGATTLSTDDAKGLFKNIFIYLDDEDYVFDSGDTVVGTITNSEINLSSGIQKIDLPNNVNTQIGTGGTRYYFLVLELKGTATLAAKHTFNAIIDGDQCTIREDDAGMATHTIQSTDPATSTPTTKVVMNSPEVDVDDTAPLPPTMTDGEKEDLLRLKIYHGETDTNLQDIRFGTLNVTFIGGKTGATLTSTEAQGLFSDVYVYLDTGNDGVYGSSTDTTRVDSGAGISGMMSIPIGSSTNTRIAPAGSKTYFLVIQLKNNASKQGTRSFVAVIDSVTDAYLVEQDTQFRLEVTSLDSPVRCATVTAQSQIPTVTVNVSNDTLPTTPYNMRDDDKDDLLRIKITHNGTTTEASMWLVQMEAIFTDLNDALTTAEAKSLFDNIYVYLDTANNEFEVSDTLVKTIANNDINLSPNGTLSISFTKNSNTIIATNTTKTYFLVVELKEDASGTQTHTFNAAIDGDRHIVLKDTNIEENGTVTIYATDTVTSYNVRAVPKNPQVAVSSTAPTTIKDGNKDDLLRLQITHTGTKTAGKIEFATLTIKFKKPDGTPLSDTDVQALFGTVSVYYDLDKDGYETSDTLVGSATGNAILGTLTFTFDESTSMQIEGGSSSIYFVVVSLTGTASSYGTKTFIVEIGTTSDVLIEAVSDDTLLNISLTPGSSTKVTAIPENPKVEVSDISTPILQDDTQPKNGLLAVKVTNMGIQNAGMVEVATLTIRFTENGGSALNSSQAEALFENIFIYLDDNRDGNYVVNDDTTIVASTGTVSSFIDSQGYGTFTLEEGTRTQIESASFTTYFLVVELKPTASGADPKTFVASITSTWVELRDEQSNIALGLDAGSYGSLTSKITIIPVDPTATVTDTAVLMQKLQQKDTTKDDLVSIIIKNNGTSGAGAVEFGTLGVRFFATSTVPLSSTEAEALFENIYVYFDGDRDGVYSTTTDTTAVATIDDMTTFLNAAGYGTIAISEVLAAQIQAATLST
ncbi:MAG: DUF11 domain-containing protein, partial [bacterium]